MMQGKHSYVDFEPFSKWNKGEKSDTIEIHVQGFKKDELRVQVSSLGTVLVTGERQLDDKRRSRFSREFKLTKEHCLDSIQARLGNGVLHVTVPRKDANPTEKTRSDHKDHRFGDPDGCETGSKSRRFGFVDRRRVMQVTVAVLAAAAIGVGAYLGSKFWSNNAGDHVNRSMPEFSPSQLLEAVPPS